MPIHRRYSPIGRHDHVDETALTGSWHHGRPCSGPATRPLRTAHKFLVLARRTAPARAPLFLSSRDLSRRSNMMRITMTDEQPNPEAYRAMVWLRGWISDGFQECSAMRGGLAQNRPPLKLLMKTKFTTPTTGQPTTCSCKPSRHRSAPATQSPGSASALGMTVLAPAVVQRDELGADAAGELLTLRWLGIVYQITHQRPRAVSGSSSSMRTMVDRSMPVDLFGSSWVSTDRG